LRTLKIVSAAAVETNTEKTTKQHTKERKHEQSMAMNFLAKKEKVNGLFYAKKSLRAAV
jgi:hypothetical protein